MQPRIEEKPEFQVTGKRWKVSTKNGENYRVIPTYWDQAIQDGSFKTLEQSALPEGLFKGAILGVCFNFDDESQVFDYMIAVESSGNKSESRWEQQRFPPQTYAIFKNQGSPLAEAIQGSFKYIYSDWFPKSEYQPGSGPEVEVYFEDDAFEIWVPVSPKDNHPT